MKSTKDEAYAKIEIKKKFVFWYLVLAAANGEDLLVSETYYSRGNAVRAAKKLSKALKVKVVEG